MFAQAAFGNEGRVFLGLSAESHSGNVAQMPTAFDKAFRQVKDLVAIFKANETFYLSPQFSEAQTRKDFIDKLFIALGWDVNHQSLSNEAIAFAN